MNIIEALKDEDKSYDLRITCGYRWMYYAQVDDVWVVLEKRPYQHNTITIIQTKNEEMAVQFLLQQED